ncbi:MAG TPA: tetratricopeptide repeat protein [Stellaceae bacterium]|nr:tetratricopeptide repeat protein [Stellaceae bacterium]
MTGDSDRTRVIRRLREYRVRENSFEAACEFLQTQEPGATLWINGPTGCGKSRFLEDLQISAIANAPEALTLRVDVKGATSDDVAWRIGAEISKNLTRSLTEESAARLGQDWRSKLAKIGVAAIEDLAKYFGVRAEKTIKAVSEAFSTVVTPAPTDAPRRPDDGRAILAGWVRSLAAETSVVVLIDGLEHIEPSGISTLVAVYYALDGAKRSVLAVAVNDDFGLGRFRQLRSLMLARHCLRLPLADLTANEVVSWSGYGGEPLDLATAQEIVTACAGRAYSIAAVLEGGDPLQERTRLIDRTAQVLHDRIALLHDHCYRGLMGLALLPPTAALAPDVAAIVLFDDPVEGSRHIRELRDDHLLLPGTALIQLRHELLRDQLRAELDAPARAAIASQILRRAQAADLPLGAHATAFLTSDLGDAKAIVAAGPDLANQLVSEGRPNEAGEVYTLVEDAIGKAGGSFLPEFLLGKAEALHDSGNYYRSLEELAALSKLAPAGLAEARMHLMEAQNCLRLGRYRRALEQIEQLDLSSRMSAPIRYSALRALNTVLRDLGRYDEAIEVALRIGKRARRMDNEAKNRAFRTLARTYAYVDAAKAIEYGKRAEVSAEGLGIRHRGNSKLALAEAFRHAGSLREAAEKYQEAVDLGRESGNPDSVAWSLLGLADALFVAGDQVQSDRTLAEAAVVIGTPELDIPLEYLHLRLSRLASAICRGAEAPESADSVLSDYRRLSLSWADEYIAAIRRHRSPPYPKRL